MEEIFQKGIEEIVNYIPNIKEEEINTFLQLIADNCRDHEECRSLYVKKELIAFVLDKLSDETEQRALQSCRCVVNLSFYNQPAKDLMFEIGCEKLKTITSIITKYNTLRLVGASAYANLFESCEKMQELLVDDAFVAAMLLCVEDYYTICIRTINNLTVTPVMNKVFESPFFVEFLKNIPVDLADTDFSECMEFLIATLSYTSLRKAFCQYANKNIHIAFRKAIDIIVSPLFPKNVDEEDLNQVCLGIKLVLDLINDYYKYPDTSNLYEPYVDMTIAYVLHGDIFSNAFIPAPTQNHCAEILCHIASVDKFLPQVWDKHQEIIRLTFETTKNSKMMDYQKHCIGIIQSFSTNEEYVQIMLGMNILNRMAEIFTEETMMNQPLIYRCLSVLQNFTVLAVEKKVLMNEQSIHIIVTTFKFMSNIVIRYSAVQVLRNLIAFSPEFIQMFTDEGMNALLDVCRGKEEQQENEEKPDKRVRFEATRVLIKFLQHREAILTG